MTGRILVIVVLALVGMAQPVLAQVTVLDGAQDAVPAAPAPVCGTQPIGIARMSWPSAALLAEIHARVLASQFGCQTQVVPGDMAATGSSMGTTGQPAVAPELWIGRIADVWNPAIKAQMVRPAAPSYAQSVFEGWFVPDYLAAAHPELSAAAALQAVLPILAGGAKIRFISCPVDWGCSLINRNLIAALGLTDLVNIVEPANRFEMDTLIAEAVSRQEPFVFYYWQPNAVLAQLAFAAVDLGAYDAQALQCLARVACADPVPSSFAPESVVVALAEQVYADSPIIAAYFGRSSLPLSDMNALLAQLNAPGASVESVADRFVRDRADVWKVWVGATVP
ncbi:glycine betaine ABC transporter substrate-binding protein [uncultured Devosia sp.]|uniref:glycine betaine ABC transporter substrate-binding protein n=1 Tax=uncultured Devosia sp. TaxID=211434 RepID=UPI0035CC8342